MQRVRSEGGERWSRLKKASKTKRVRGSSQLAPAALSPLSGRGRRSLRQPTADRRSRASARRPWSLQSRRRLAAARFDEGRQSTQSSRSRRVLRTAGMGHQDAFLRPRLSGRYGSGPFNFWVRLLEFDIWCPTPTRRAPPTSWCNFDVVQ